MGSPPLVPTPAAAGSGDSSPSEPSRGLTFDAEHGLVGSRYIQFATRNIPPPGQLYVVGDDGLLITISNILAGVVVLVSAQLLLPDGRLSSNQFQCIPPSTGTSTQFLFPLTEGYLFNVTVQPLPTARRGQCWVTVAIRRGGLTAGVTLQTLIQDYCDAYSGPTWPGGIIRTSLDGPGLPTVINVANPAAGATMTYTVPTYLCMMVHSVAVQLNTSATVATRQMTLSYTGVGGASLWQDVVEQTQAASLIYSYFWGLKLGTLQTTVQNFSLSRSLPEMMLDPGQHIVISPVALQATDQIQTILIGVEQWYSA